jgi:hypothetical protein
VRTLIDGVLAMAGQPPIVMPYTKRPSQVDPALAVAIRYLDAEKAYGKALDRRAHEKTLGHEASDATYAAGDAAMHAADAARRAIFGAEPTTILGVASGAGLAPNVIQSYASAAKDGRSHVTIVMGDTVLLNHVMQAIGAAGRGHVTLDFVSAP